MKIKKLHIYNIASVVDATIDFDAQPLCDSDVYLITGDTGAGKTTILDSICLALFNNTPRLNKGKLTKVKNGIDNLTLKDPRRLMRRNTGEAAVELCFEAKGHDYKVEWQVQRGKKKKVSVAVDNINRSFTDLSKNETITSIGTKDSELQAKIKEVIGLDFDQFCRTTMLAQNEFTKFLSSDEDERAEILEKITQTSEFSAVGAKVFELTSLKKSEWEKAQEDASDTGLTNEQIEEKKKQVEELKAEAERKKQERDTADKKRNWIKREKILAKSEEQAKASYNEARETLTSEKYKAGCLFVQQWNDSIDARKWLDEITKANNEAKAHEKELSNYRYSFQIVRNGFQYAKEEVEGLQQELNSINAFLDNNASKADTYANVQTITTHLDTIVNKTNRIKELNAIINTNENQLNEKLIPERDKSKEELENAKKSKEDIDKDIEQKEKELKDLNMKALRDERDETKDLVSKVERAIKSLSDIVQAENKYNQETERIAIVEKDIEKKQKNFDEKLLPQYEQAKKQKIAAETARDLLSKSVHDFAKQMRLHLQIGCECPVCRQRVNILPLEEKIDKAYREADRKFKEAKEDYEKAESDKNKAESIINTDKKRLNEDTENHKADKSIEKAKDSAAQDCRECGINSIDETTNQQLLNLKNDKQEHIDKVLNPNIKKGEDIEKDLMILRKKQKHHSSEFEQKRKDFDNANKKVEEITSKIEKDKGIVEDNKKEIETAKEKVRPFIADAIWEHDWTVKPGSFKYELIQAAEVYSNNKKHKEKLHPKIAQMEDNNKKIHSIINQIIEKQPSWNNLIPVKQQQKNLFELANNLLHNVGISTTSLSDAKKRFEENSTFLTDFLDNNPLLTKERLEELNRTTSITELVKSLEEKRQEPGQKKALWEKSKKDYLEHLETKPALTEDETVESLDNFFNIADSDISKLNQQVGVIEKELKEDAKKKNGISALKDKEEKARMEYERWQRLNRLIGDKEGKTFRTIAQSYIFDNILHSANVYLQKLEPRYTLKTVSGTLYSALEDAHQGFASRDTSSLSGGESFLVSLALALALSDIGQGLSVDTLFIDEGFGSLSGRPLTNAINTLRSLRSKNGRHVGIISHIQEVRENIPVQIQVNKSSDNSSSTITITQ